jgi:hypothetical protein
MSNRERSSANPVACVGIDLETTLTFQPKLRQTAGYAAGHRERVDARVETRKPTFQSGRQTRRSCDVPAFRGARRNLASF